MSSHLEKQKELEDRTIHFGVSVIKKCGPLGKQITLRPLVDQITRSSTSVGANYAEANNASSKADFRSKIFISKKEAAETRYWLKVLALLVPEEDFSTLEQEALELNLIFQKIITTIRHSNEK